MLKLYTDILDRSRLEMWSKLGAFRDVGVLGGGTALALQLNHRISYDFDIFSLDNIKRSLLLQVRNLFPDALVSPRIDTEQELTVFVDRVKLTFLHYPFKPITEVKESASLTLFSIEDIAADKAYTIGRRGAWRDYFDIFSLLNSGTIDLKTLTDFAEKKFGSLFSKKLFFEQLIYFGDIDDFSIETVDGKIASKQEVQDYLRNAVKVAVVF